MRRPARLERAGALTPRDRMWSAIRALSSRPGLAFSALEVQFIANLKASAEAQVHVDSVVLYLTGLASATPPIVKRVGGDEPGRKRSELQLYFLDRDLGVEAPRVTKDGKPVTQGLGVELMWNAMKALREFDCRELLAAVAEGAERQGVAVSEASLRTYCHYLCRAGYLVRDRRRYRFVRLMNSGPRAPLVCKDKSVMDANTGKTVWRKEEAACRT